MAQEYNIGLVLNEITDLTDIPQDGVIFGGGGKGQTALVVVETLTDPLEIVGKGTSRLAAVTDLLDKIKAYLIEQEPTPEPTSVKVERPQIADALTALRGVFGEFDVNDETDERTPGPTWAGTRLVSLTPCVGECMFASPDSPCDCRCGGDNHAIGGAMFISAMIDAIAAGDTKAAKVAIKAARPVMLTPKPCTCGCGGLTLRRFVPGHDARYHAAIKAGFATVAEHAAAKAQAAQVKAQSRDSKEQHAQLQSDKAAAKAADAALPF